MVRQPWMTCCSYGGRCSSLDEKILDGDEPLRAEGRWRPNCCSRGAWRQPAPARTAPIDDDDDVPQSLLLEGGHGPAPGSSKRGEGLPMPVPGPSTRQTRAQWDATRTQQRLHDDDRRGAPSQPWGHTSRPGHFAADPREKALWLYHIFLPAQISLMSSKAVRTFDCVRKSHASWPTLSSILMSHVLPACLNGKNCSIPTSQPILDLLAT